MATSQKKPVNDNILFATLICSLFTLNPTQAIFEKFSITNLLNLGSSNSPEIFSTTLFTHLEKQNLRQFSYFLITPLLSEAADLDCPNPEFVQQTLYLKKYLQKFKFFYKYFLFQDIKNFSTIPTNKEINYLGVVTLFQLVGI